MNSIFSASIAKKLLIAGGLLWIACTLVSWVILWNVYGQAGASFNEDEAKSPNLETFELIAGINVYFAYFSYVLLGLGLLLLIIIKLRSKK